MYASIKGILSQTALHYVVIEANGIGFKILIPSNVTGQIPAIGQELLLHTSYVVREFSHALYGFQNKEERDLFELLIDISGVGPKIALGLIGHLSLSGLQQVVLEEDLASLCKVPGIGKKTGERLLVELKNRLDSFFQHLPAPIALPKGQTSQLQDAIKALVNLGYNQSAAHKAVKKSLEESENEPDLAQLITSALRKL